VGGGSRVPKVAEGSNEKKKKKSGVPKWPRNPRTYEMGLGGGLKGNIKKKRKSRM